MMNPGRFRERVNIQSHDATRDEYGEETATWTTDETIRVEISPMSGRERWDASAVQSEVTHRITGYYTSSANARKRLQHSVDTGRTWQIMAVRDVEPDYRGAERGRFMILDCKELTP